MVWFWWPSKVRSIWFSNRKNLRLIYWFQAVDAKFVLALEPQVLKVRGLIFWNLVLHLCSICQGVYASAHTKDDVFDTCPGVLQIPNIGMGIIPISVWSSAKYQYQYQYESYVKVIIFFSRYQTFTRLSNSKASATWSLKILHRK